MWISKDYKLKDIIEKGVFKVEFYHSDFGSSLENLNCDILKLKDICKLRKKNVTPRNNPEKLYNYISLSNIESDTGDLIDFMPIRGAEIKTSCREFKKGDILYGRLRPYLNKCYYVNDKIEEGICTNECYVLTPKSNINAGYLHVILLSKFVLDQVNYITRGASRPRIQENDFLSLEIPILNESDQERTQLKFHESMMQRRELIKDVSKILEKAKKEFIDQIITN